MEVSQLHPVATEIGRSEMSVLASQVDDLSRRGRFVPSDELTKRISFVGALAAIVTLAGIMFSPERTWASLLLVSVYLVEIALGGMLFLATQAVASGGWYVCFKRVPEAMASTLPYGAILLMLTLAGGMGALYEWSHADLVAADPLLSVKAPWLDVPFFLARALLVLAIWYCFAVAMRRVSRRQDESGNEGGITGNRRMVILSAAFLVVFAFTFSVASFDWLMSLEARWFSTLFAGYHFAGAFVSGLATITVLVILLRRQSCLKGIVTDDHLHDLGKLLFGFTSFWAYLWFSQYMLIWYGNLPEEVGFFVTRHEGAWAVVSAANALIGWGIPFLVLLPRAAKRSEHLMLKMAGLLLVAHWVDLYLAVQPALSPAAPRLGIWELAPVVGAVALFMLAFRRNFASTDVVPRGDAFLSESLHHHQ